MSERKTLGETIRDLREENSLSMRSLARVVGLSATSMSDIENGRRFPGLIKLMSIAEVLEVEWTDLAKLDSRNHYTAEYLRELSGNPAWSELLHLLVRKIDDHEVTPTDLQDLLDDA